MPLLMGFGVLLALVGDGMEMQWAILIGLVNALVGFVIGTFCDDFIKYFLTMVSNWHHNLEARNDNVNRRN